MEKKTRFNVTYVLIALFGVLLLQNLWMSHRALAQIAYSEFQKLLERGSSGSHHFHLTGNLEPMS